MKAKQMNNNGKGAVKISDDERETARLRELLQKAVNREKTPESLREKLRRMIRE